MLALKLCDLFVCDLDLSLVVHFVCQHHDLYVGARVLLYLTEPDRDAQKALSVRHVKDHDYTVSTLVVGICDRSVAFLAGRIPNLQLDRRLVDLQGAEAEVHSNRAQVVLLEAVIL